MSTWSRRRIAAVTLSAATAAPILAGTVIAVTYELGCRIRRRRYEAQRRRRTADAARAFDELMQQSDGGDRS